MHITVQDLLNVYYAPFWDLARLCEASAVERDLDPAKARTDPESIGGREHTWHWCCTEPVQLMKLWSDLYQLRLKAPYGDRQQFAPPQLFDDCLSVYDMLGTLTLLIEPRLAKLYMYYILFIEPHVAVEIRRQGVFHGGGGGCGVQVFSTFQHGAQLQARRINHFVFFTYAVLK